LTPDEPMETHPVEIWTLPLTREVPTHLSEDEVTRANRFRSEEDRVRWIRARSSLRMILSRYAGDDPGSLYFGYGKHGKPGLLPFTKIQFNLSHAGDFAIVAVTQSVPVGVDIERIRNNVDMAALLRRLGETDLPSSMTDLYRIWTRREAKTKAAGGALFDKPSGDVCAIDITAPAGYTASVALPGREPIVSYRTFS
jgi:4'-phosphopantetheinyl transferase